MIVSQNYIDIIERFKTEGLSKFNDNSKRLNEGIAAQGELYASLSSKQKRFQENLNMNRVAQQGFFKTMRMGLPEWQNFNKTGRQFTTIGGRMANRLRMMAHGMKGFKMEMLGVMFFGMSLYRVMTGLIKTSTDWLGVTEIFTTTLGILFLPVAELLLEWALAFLDWVLNLTEEQKTLIGYIVLFTAALGGVLLVIGSLALGIGSLILAFGALFNPISLILLALAGLAAYFIYKKYFDDTSEAVDGLRSSLMTFGVSGEVFDKVAMKIKDWYSVVKKYLFGNNETGEIGLVKEIKNKIIEFTNSDEIKTAGASLMGRLVEGVQEFFKNNPLVIVGAIVGTIVGGPAGATIGAALGGLFNRLDMEKMDEVISKGMEILDGIIQGLVDNKEKIGEALSKIIEAIMTWIGEHSDEILEVGIAIGKGIAKGIAKGFKNAITSENLFTKWTGISDVVNMFQWGNSKIQSVGDAIISPDGNVITTNPNDYLIATTNPNSLGSNGNNFNITYNISGVSSPNDIKRMLETNNRQLTDEIRRSVKI